MNLEFWFQPTECIFDFFKATALDFGDEYKRRLFFDRSGKILFVAHLDTVQTPNLIEATDKVIVGAGLDDRLGCYLAYNLSEQYGADVLLCDKEEKGRSTASAHIVKKYNWIVEFDRAGTDVVMYRRSSALAKALRELWTIGEGSFSDITFLKTETAAFNMGIGYTYAHLTMDIALIADIKTQMNKLHLFFRKYKNTRFTLDQTKGDFYGYATFNNFNRWNGLNQQ